MATLVLTRADIAALMTPADYLDAVARGFAALAQGRALAPPPLHVPLIDGGCHAKAARLDGDGGARVALKFNANLPHNPQRCGLPTIQGAILLCDADDGRLLAVMDSIEPTLRRTAAASALAARHLARADAAVLAVCGCGAQALPQVEALAAVLPLRRVRLWDRDAAAAQRLQARGTAALPHLAWQVATRVAEATLAADAIVTCTSSVVAFLTPERVPPGSFVAAVGADSPAKSEITPALMARCTVVVDSLAQCLEMGDLHHAVAAGAMQPGDVHAELGAVVLGTRPGRQGPGETWLFDSTGVGVQDTAAAVLIHQRALARGAGIHVDLGA